MKIGFTINDDYGLFPQDEEDESKIPYYGIELTEEQAKLVEGKIAGIYETDAKQLFDIKDDKGITGKKMLYVVWI